MEDGEVEYGDEDSYNNDTVKKAATSTMKNHTFKTGSDTMKSSMPKG